MRTGAEFQPESVIRLLGRHRVRYVLIGGLAAVTHGAPVITQDIDACYARDDPNLRRIAAALIEVHAELQGCRSRPAPPTGREDAASGRRLHVLDGRRLA